MTLTEIFFIASVVLLCGLALPLSHGARMFIFLALATLGVLIFIGAGVHGYLGMFR
ncbi:MAG: hypothetical protein JO001_29070 [Alphaproteobacteria bacterium]|nr:hypothetical protein [Alphaproteobacteria bacterium]